MNREEVKKKIRAAIDCQIYERGYATCVDTLLKIGWLTSQNLHAWKKGQIPYLERVLTMNLGQCKLFLDYYRGYAISEGYMQNWTYYRQSGGKRQLQFTKSKDDYIERLYATHIVCMQMKGAKLVKNNSLLKS